MSTKKIAEVIEIRQAKREQERIEAHKARVSEEYSRLNNKNRPAALFLKTGHRVDGILIKTFYTLDAKLVYKFKVDGQVRFYDVNEVGEIKYA